MNDIAEKWILELPEELDLIQSSEVNEEARSNMFTFGIDETWSNKDIVNFISKCAEVYASKNTLQPMWFYSWYDDQAFQLRLSAVSQEHKKLPFGCTLKQVAIEDIAQDVINQTNGLMKNNKLNIWQTNI
jgi:hypothetical protein